MSETREIWLGVVNNCINYVHQAHEIYQVLSYSQDFKAPQELWNPLSKTVNIVLFGIKDPHTYEMTIKLKSNSYIEHVNIFPNFWHCHQLSCTLHYPITAKKYDFMQNYFGFPLVMTWFLPSCLSILLPSTKFQYPRYQPSGSTPITRDTSKLKWDKKCTRKIDVILIIIISSNHNFVSFAIVL